MPRKVGMAGQANWAALTMRRRCLGGRRPGGFLLGLASLDLDEGEPLSFERNEIDLADRVL